jgi:hypothetical protein
MEAARERQRQTGRQRQSEGEGEDTGAETERARGRERACECVRACAGLSEHLVSVADSVPAVTLSARKWTVLGLFLVLL